jgi:anti-sigma regulatory factor (Ser/Thr protein kinase)
MASDDAELRLALPADDQAPGRARALVRRLEGHCTAEAMTDLELVVSELVTNAVMHGRGVIEVLLQPIRDGRVRGHVADEGDGRVAVRPRADDTGGMGLRLVDAVARWGVHAPPTRVWFELPRAPGA